MSPIPMYAISKDLYCVILFLEHPDENIEDTVCVPYSWVKEKKRSGTTYVSYPIEDEKETELRVRKRVAPSKEWRTYQASLLYLTESYEVAENYIAKRIKCLLNKKRKTPNKEHKAQTKKETKALSTPTKAQDTKYKKPKLNPASVKLTEPIIKDNGTQMSDDEGIQNVTRSDKDVSHQVDQLAQTDPTICMDRATNTSPSLGHANLSSNSTHNQRFFENRTNVFHLEPHANLRTHDDVNNIMRADPRHAISSRRPEDLDNQYRTLRPLFSSSRPSQNYYDSTGNDNDIIANRNITVNILPSRPTLDISNNAAFLSQYQNYLPQAPRNQNIFPQPCFDSHLFTQAYVNQRTEEQIQWDRRNVHLQTHSYINQTGREQIQSNSSHMPMPYSYYNQAVTEQIVSNRGNSSHVLKNPHYKPTIPEQTQTNVRNSTHNMQRQYNSKRSAEDQTQTNAKKISPGLSGTNIINLTGEQTPNSSDNQTRLETRPIVENISATVTESIAPTQTQPGNTQRAVQQTPNAENIYQTEPSCEKITGEQSQSSEINPPRRGSPQNVEMHSSTAPKIASNLEEKHIHNQRPKQKTPTNERTVSHAPKKSWNKMTIGQSQSNAGISRTQTPCNKQSMSPEWLMVSKDQLYQDPNTQNIYVRTTENHPIRPDNIADCTPINVQATPPANASPNNTITHVPDVQVIVDQVLNIYRDCTDSLTRVMQMVNVYRDSNNISMSSEKL